MSKKKIAIIFVIITFFLALVGFLYFFFKPKEYTYYIKESVGEIQGVNIYSDDYETNDIWVYDSQDIEQLFECFESLKAWPCSSVSEGGAGFSIEFMDDEEKGVLFSARDGGKYYIVDISLRDNGKPIEDTIWGTFGKLYISKEDGEKLFEIVNNIYSENYRNTSVEDIRELSENNVTDWRKFKQFKYEEIVDGELIEVDNSTKSERPVRFMIDGTEGYMDVWYYEVLNWNVEKDVAQKYSKVVQATVYNGTGESMDLYSEEIDGFLEMMRRY